MDAPLRSFPRPISWVMGSGAARPLGRRRNGTALEDDLCNSSFTAEDMCCYCANVLSSEAATFVHLPGQGGCQRGSREMRPQTAEDKASISGQLEDVQQRPRCEGGGLVLVTMCWFQRVEMPGRRTRARRPRWQIPAALVSSRYAMVGRRNSGEAWWLVYIMMPVGDGMQSLCGDVLA